MVNINYKTTLLLVLFNSASSSAFHKNEKYQQTGGVVELLNQDEANLGSLTKVAMRLMEQWNLNSTEQLSILGLTKRDRVNLARYRSGRVGDVTIDQYQRVGHVLAIDGLLRSLFPGDKHAAHHWMTAVNKAFDNKRPVDWVDEHGFIGLISISHYLSSYR